MEISKDLSEYPASAVTADEAAEFAVALAGLLDSHGWRVYQEILKRYRILTREGFESAEDMTGVANLKGMLMGLNLATSLPDMIINLAEDRADRLDAKEQKESSVRTQARRAILSPSGEESF